MRGGGGYSFSPDLSRPLLHYNSIVFYISGNEHILLHYGPLEATLGNKVSPSPLWQISPCMIADCRGKMATLERRTCTIILRNWHHNPRFATVALVHFVLSNVTAPSSDFFSNARMLRCSCTCVLNQSALHLEHGTLLSNRQSAFWNEPCLPRSFSCPHHNRILLSGTTGLRL